jgi:hypothetical protein
LVRTTTSDGVDDDVELLEMLEPYQLPPPEVFAVVERFAGYKYKTGRDGNLTLLFPTQEAMENYLDAPVKNYTLTVYWYLNSSIVYKDAFNLTKRGYNVDQSRHSRRNIRPRNISRQRQTSQRPLRQNMVVQRNIRSNNLPRPHNTCRPRQSAN